MAVDLHAHLAKEDPEAPKFMAHLFDVDGYLEKQAEAGIDRTILSYALAEPKDSTEELDKAKGEHEFLAGLIEQHGDRLGAFAGVDVFAGDGWLEEAARALDAGFSGLCFPTSREGRYLDAPETQDAFAFANERKAVVFLHPSDSPFPTERAGDGALREWIGRPSDTGVCLSRLLLADTLGRYPEVRMVVAHSGGTAPMLLGRLDSVYEGFQRRAAMRAKKGGPGGPGGPPGGGGGPPKGVPKALTPEEGGLEASTEGAMPSRRIGQLYFDTASYHPASVNAAIGVVGVERMVLGTDYPPAGDSPRPVIDLIQQMNLADGDREAILSRNAEALLSR
jgi:predicted TIM-barrel fold metal-dependent hydrolase